MPRKRVSPKMARTSVRLPKKQIAALEELVRKGEFMTTSEAARAAIDQGLAKKLDGLEKRKKLLELLKKAKKR